MTAVDIAAKAEQDRIDAARSIRAELLELTSIASLLETPDGEIRGRLSSVLQRLTHLTLQVKEAEATLRMAWFLRYYDHAP